MTLNSILHALHGWSAVIVGIGFLAVLIGAYWPGRRAAMERHGMIPLEDDR